MITFRKKEHSAFLSGQLKKELSTVIDYTQKITDRQNELEKSMKELKPLSLTNDVEKYNSLHQEATSVSCRYTACKSTSGRYQAPILLLQDFGFRSGIYVFFM